MGAAKCVGNGDFIGARLAIYPMQDNFVDIILDAVGATDPTGLRVFTDDVATGIQGPVDRVFAFVEEVFVRAAAAGGHVVGNILLSGG